MAVVRRLHDDEVALAGVRARQIRSASSLASLPEAVKKQTRGARRRRGERVGILGHDRVVEVPRVGVERGQLRGHRAVSPPDAQ